MTLNEIAETLDVARLTHQLAVSAAVEELLSMPASDPRAKMLRQAINTSYGCFATAPHEYAANVVTLPVKRRTSWTVLKNLEGERVHCSSGFGPGGAWSWIVDTVAAEHGVDEDRIGNLEGIDGEDDLVTVDGLPVYRIEHTCEPFENSR